MNQQNLFDGKRSEQLKQQGMDLAADNVPTALELARSIARKTACLYGTVNADEVGKRLKEIYKIDTLGPAAGSIFRGKEWEFTGKWIKSTRITNHGRMIREWRLK